MTGKRGTSSPVYPVSIEKLPATQLCVIRQVLQHLNNDDISEILKKLNIYKYVIITEHLPIYPASKNSNKTTGSRIRLDKKKPSGVFLEAPPFSLKYDVLLNYREDHSKTPAIMHTVLLKNSGIS